MPNIIDRIKLIISLSGLTVNSYAQKIGVNPQTLYKYIGGRMPAVESLQKILSSYPDVSAEWLLMGEGEMKKQSVELLKEQIRVKDEQIMGLIEKIKWLYCLKKDTCMILFYVLVLYLSHIKTHIQIKVIPPESRKLRDCLGAFVLDVRWLCWNTVICGRCRDLGEGGYF